MTYDYSKLNGKIVEKYNTRTSFADKMGWSTRTMSLKLNNKRSWKQEDIQKAAGLLGIEKNEIADYFFNY